ncbi:MAG: nucleotidyltransferase family protein [Ignavibacteria bacterium]|nr:nucleotidyltransferase family protein [Ignavibacteria bacterium]
MKNSFKDVIVDSSDSILFVLKKMDEVNRKLLIVMEEKRFLSIISIGDIQRAIINNIDLNTRIKNILRSQIRVAKIGDDINEIKNNMNLRRNEFMPILSETGELYDVIFWEDIFQTKFNKSQNKINLPVVIMAGGKGSRLKPITNVLPKPLIPLREKTIIEEIFSSFSLYGCNDFYVSVNYKADFIEYYLKEQNLPYNISFFREDKPLGTAGSLYLIKNEIKETFFVTNCDILIDEDYSEILEYHRKNSNEITIVAALKNYSIPYGVIETGNNGKLVEILEKPDITFKINSGMYILEPNLLNEIPQNDFYHITHLINQLLKRDGKIGVFPVSEKSWIDIGNWKDYLRSSKSLNGENL